MLGYFGVSIIHRTVTRTTGPFNMRMQSSCVCTHRLLCTPPPFCFASSTSSLPSTSSFLSAFYPFLLTITLQYNFIAKCQYTDCTRDVLWSQVHSSHIPVIKHLIDDLRKSRGLHSVSAYGHGLYIYRSRPAGVAQSRHAFVGGTVSTWAR